MSPLKRRLPALLFLAALILAVLWRGWERQEVPPDLLTLDGFVWTTTWSVRVSHPPADPELRALLRASVEEELRAIDTLMSRFNENSVLSRFNRHRSLEPFPVPEELLATVALALEVGRRTDGAYDITVAPLMRLWGFGDLRGREVKPDAEEIAASLEGVGYEHLTVSFDPPSLQKAVPELELDLSSIAKGTGVDRVSALLERLGVENYLVDVGGDLRVRGVRPDGNPWRIGIERPLLDRREVHRVLELTSLGVASSGEYRNYVVIDGQRVSHTMDPRVGRPVAHPPSTVTVLAETAEEADAWATAMNVMGVQEGLRLADELGLSVHFLTLSEEGLVERESEAFRRLLGP